MEQRAVPALSALVLQLEGCVKACFVRPVVSLQEGKKKAKGSKGVCVGRAEKRAGIQKKGDVGEIERTIRGGERSSLSRVATPLLLLARPLTCFSSGVMWLVLHGSVPYYRCCFRVFFSAVG